MSNPYDNSASKSYAPASTKELPKLPYDIFLLVVEAFLESAHAEISSEPASWAIWSEQAACNDANLLPEVLFILDKYYDGNKTRKKRFRLLRGISQVDLKARHMVDQRFPRFAFMEGSHNPTQKFVHICAKVDLFAISSASCITDSLSPPVKPRFLDMLRVLENVYLVSGHFDLESLGAMPNLKSVSLSMVIDTGPHGHVRPYFAQKRTFSPRQWKAIRECSKELQGLAPDAWIDRNTAIILLLNVKDLVAVLRATYMVQPSSGSSLELYHLNTLLETNSLTLIMVDPSDSSALSHHRSPSAKTEGPGLPYEIYLLLVDAFLDSAHAEVSAQPGFWRFKNERRCGTNGYLPPRLVLCRDWGQIALRHRLLRGISQTDLESQKRVNRQFPRFPYRDIWIKQDYIDYPGFAYICPSVDLFEPDHEPGYTTQAGLLRALLQPTPVNSELLQVIENIQLYGWCATDPDLPCFLLALPNLRTISFVWEPPSSDWPSPPCLSSHVHQNPPTIYDSEQDDGITEWWAILRRCSFAWEKGVRLLYCSHEDRAWPGHWPSNEVLFDPTLGELPFRIIQFVAGCKDCLDALPCYSLRERSPPRLRPSSFGLIPIVDDADPSVTLNNA